MSLIGLASAWLAALGVALLATPAARRIAVRAGVLDRPGRHKGHREPVPYLGGVAIAAAFFAGTVVAALAAPAAANRRFGVLLTLAVLIGAVGLVDDLRGLSAGVRLAVQGSAAVLLWTQGVDVTATGVAVLDLVLTVVWIVGVTNAFNLLDNMDGLSAGVAGVAALWCFLLAAFAGQYLVAAAALALTGSALGFLRSNWHPARIYMGDAGSLFLGFVLAVLALELDVPTSAPASFAVPVLVLGVAILDTSLVTITRLLGGRSPFHGGRDHVSHRLIRLGLDVPRAVALLCAGGAALGGLGVLVAWLGGTAGLALAALATLVVVILGVRLAAVPIGPGTAPVQAPAPLPELIGRSGA